MMMMMMMVYLFMHWFIVKLHVYFPATTVKLAGLLDGSLAGRKRSASDVGELDVLCNELDNIGRQHL